MNSKTSPWQIVRSILRTMRVTQKNLTTPPVHLPLDLDSMSSNTKLEELHLQVGTLHENLPSLFDHRHLEESKHC